MAEGHGRDRWGRMSALLALIRNCHTDTRKHGLVKPADINPYENKERDVIEVTPENIGELKEAFMAMKGGRL